MGQLSWEAARGRDGTLSNEPWESWRGCGRCSLHKRAGVGLWRGWGLSSCAAGPGLPVLRSITSSAHFSLLPLRFVVSQRMGLLSVISSPHPPFPSWGCLWSPHLPAPLSYGVASHLPCLGWGEAAQPGPLPPAIWDV